MPGREDACLLGGAVAQPDVVAVGVTGPEPVVGDHVAGVLLGVLLEEVDLEEGDEEHDLEPAEIARRGGVRAKEQEVGWGGEREQRLEGGADATRREGGLHMARACVTEPGACVLLCLRCAAMLFRGRVAAGQASTAALLRRARATREWRRGCQAGVRRASAHHAAIGSAAHDEIAPPGMSLNLICSAVERKPGQRRPL